MQNNFKNTVGVLLILFFSNYSFSQDSFWTLINKKEAKNTSLSFIKNIPQKSSFIKLDFKAFTNSLKAISKRGESYKSKTVLSFPNAYGELESYSVMEASVMTKELQVKFPNIRSFVGKGIDNPSSTIRFSISNEKGLSSMVLSDEKTIFIEPYDLTHNTYISYVNSVNDKKENDFECLTESYLMKNKISEEEYKALKNANDGQLRTYRLALACTVEYSQFHGGTLPDVVAAMNTTMTRVNGIFERDLSVTMVMVPNQSIIFLGPDTNSDPFTNSDNVALLSENQTVCDNNIGTKNYDIGHVFSTSFGGVAYRNSPCTSNFKAGGVTGLASPVGDRFDIDFVAHEMGHQYGANHTQNNDCERSSVSVEPGSASTIMGYAGICAPNIQSNSDDYFHGESIEQMWLNISQGNSSKCGQVSSTGNTAPVVDAGPDYFIPKSTPFILKGNGSDVDTNDFLTYTWEQNDATPAPMPPQSTSMQGPLFRSLPPTQSTDRYMPSFSTVLSGSLESTWEVVPSVARTMGFLLTVRDNSDLGGNSNSDEVLITVVNTAPFEVLTPPTWAPGSTQTVNWTVGETNLAPINCQTVDIYFSKNGVDFNTLLAGNVPNSGSAEITIPSIGNTTNVRILVEAVDNIFYSVSEPFNIDSNPDFNFYVLNEGQETRCNQDVLNFEFDFSTSNGFSETTAFTASGPNQANYNFSPTSLNTDGNFSLEVSNLSSVTPGNYTIQVIAASASISKSANVNMTVSASSICTSVANIDYETSTTGVIINDGQADILSNLNTGKPSGYKDYTSIVTDLTVNSGYDLTINANSAGNYDIITYVWIDWNQNCSFEDQGEQYDLGTSSNLSNLPTSVSPLTFTVPSNAVLGNTTMRVTTKFTQVGTNQFPLPCENDHDAEVEDYTINVKSTLSKTNFSLQDLSIYPNPNQGQFNIRFDAQNSTEVQIRIHDIRGKSLVQKTYEVFGSFNQMMDLSGYSSGLYLIKINDGSQTVTKKIIIH
jgi:hypothetical protein